MFFSHPTTFQGIVPDKIDFTLIGTFLLVQPGIEDTQSVIRPAKNAPIKLHFNTRTCTHTRRTFSRVWCTRIIFIALARYARRSMLSDWVESFKAGSKRAWKKSEKRDDHRSAAAVLSAVQL